MARLLTSGAEWQDATAELNPTGASGSPSTTATFSTVTPISGNVSFLNGITQWVVCSTPGTIGVTLGHTVFARITIQTDAYPVSGPINLLEFLDTSQTVLAGRLEMNNDGTVFLSSGVVTSAAVPLNTNTTIEFSMNIGTGSVDTVAWRLNGVLQESLTGQAISDTAIGYFKCLANSFSGFRYDDIAVNDDTGAAQNSWPGTGKIVLLSPSSDNAKGTGWTNDAAGASNFFDSVNNAPPVGIADTTVGSGLHQIRNATANANVNYDANLTTYTAAGIGASDTMNVLVPMVATAAPVTTSSKQGTVGMSANPVIANVALGAGGTAGAFWSGVAAGTYSTGWKWSFGSITYAPSVTVGSAPVMRITQVTSSTRIAMVCAMGMYVDYTPAVVIPPTPLVHQSIPFYPRASRPS